MVIEKQAKAQLEQGFILAEEKGLKEIATKVIEERVILENEINKWSVNGKVNLSLPDRINQAELGSYVTKALRAFGRI